jgi:hypothetical protein
MSLVVPAVLAFSAVYMLVVAASYLALAKS